MVSRLSFFLTIMNNTSILNKQVEIENENIYEPPMVRVVEVEVEKGFAASIDMQTEEGEW